MADITITTTAVIPGTGPLLKTVVAGEAITIGQAVYVRSSNGQAYKADANDTATPANLIDGVAVSTATAAGQSIVYQYGGILAFGAIMTAGKIYVSSATPGGIAPAADLSSGWSTNVIGYAETVSNMRLQPYASGVVS